MVRYPHTLDVSWQEDGHFSSTTGDYVEGEEYSVSIKGRAEANSKGNLVRLTDGSQVVYDYTFFCEPQEELRFGSKAELYEGSVLKYKGTIRRMASAQKHCQIWL
jgi:hypothetical protein